MKPIQELLNQIRWDKEFAKGEFEISYYDRVVDRTISIPLKEVYFDPDDHFSFQLIDPEGEVHLIPLHRIRKVSKDGHIIWRRDG